MRIEKSSNPFELITSKNAVNPNYDLSSRQFSLDIYLSHAGELCIMGRLDNNYICGLSFSTVADMERTQAIINGMVNAVHTPVSHESAVLGARYQEVTRWYRMKISQIEESGKLPYTIPGAGGYFAIQDMARGIKQTFSNLVKTCEIRLANGLYLPVLHYYHQLLTRYKRHDSEACDYYHQMKILIDNMKSESYLKLSPDSAIRELYLSIEEAGGSLYGAYMDKAR